MPGVPQESVMPATEQPEGTDANDADLMEGRRRMSDSQPAHVVEPTAPIPDTEQYVFVRRDGTVFFAVAFAWENGTLRYVTSEGLKRNIARSALDLDATQQFNEQRGLSFRLPA